MAMATLHNIHAGVWENPEAGFVMPRQKGCELTTALELSIADRKQRDKRFAARMRRLAIKLRIAELEEFRNYE